MEVIAFHPKHLEIANIRQHELDTLFKMKDAYTRVEQLAKLSKQSGTFILDGRIITCAGFIEIWPGVAEVWQIPSIYAEENPIAFCKAMKGYIESIAETFKYHRIQTNCPADEKHERWMEFLGFKNETPDGMKAFTTDKRTYNAYARIFDGS